jgi:hypothetical protein
MNPELLMLVIGVMVAAAVVYISPPLAMRVGSCLIAHATALDAARHTYRTQFAKRRPRPAKRRQPAEEAQTTL